MKFKDHYTFLLLKPSTHKRKSQTSNHSVADDIIEHIKKFGFIIISNKKINPTYNDILRLYQEYLDSVKKDNPDNAVKMFEGYKSTLKNESCSLILLYHPKKNAKEYLCEIKGDNFKPSQCSHDSIRYLHRNIEWDKFCIEPGTISDFIPDDNVVHSPRNGSEFYPIINKYMKKEWETICSKIN
ncbi:MAG: hypothetical protein ACOCZQ_01660 [Nanoarchaeota archaeon]